MTLLSDDQQYIMKTYHRLPLHIVFAQGSDLIDENGYRYLDFFSGIAVNGLGYNEALVDCMKAQADSFVHLSNYFVCESAVNLAKLLVNHSFASQVFYTNTGTEANEAAIKLCRKVGRQKAADKVEILSAYRGFHGRTMGSLSLTPQAKYQAPFGPLLPHVNHFQYNDSADFLEKVSHQTCAVFLEIIQGEGGVVTLDSDFLKTVLEARQQYDFLLVIDEIQTGLGRSGKLFSFEHYDVTPDIVTIAKSLGGGIPLGAMLVSKSYRNAFLQGEHGSTFAPNPVACAGGVYLMQQLTQTLLLQEVSRKSEWLMHQLRQLQMKYQPIIKEVRGCGLMIGLEVGAFASDIKERALTHRLLLNVTSVTIIRLLPPLTIKDEELQRFVHLFERILQEVSDDFIS